MVDAEAVDDSERPTAARARDDQVERAAQAPTDAVLKASLLAGTGGTIGKFHVLRLLGEGGMGMVFAAYDVELDRKVAIKVLRAGDPSANVEASVRALEARRAGG